MPLMDFLNRPHREVHHLACNLCGARILASGKQSYLTGAFLMYQSNLQPLPMLGYRGDLWVTTHAIYVKDRTDEWSEWTRKSEHCCPYDDTRQLVWSRNAELKYLPSYRPEASKWKNCATTVPLACIPATARTTPAVRAALQKDYYDLEDDDIIVLLNTRCDSLRAQHNITDSTKDYVMPSRQKTYEPFPVSTYREPPDGRECSGFVKLWNGMEMFLPYCEGDVEQNPDVLSCKWIARESTDATSCLCPVPHTDPSSSDCITQATVTVVTAPPDGSPISLRREHVMEVRRLLAMGRAVVVKPAQERVPHLNFDEESIKELTHRNPNGTVMEWISSLARHAVTASPPNDDREESERIASTSENMKGTVRQFFQAAANKRDRVNCLDMQIPNGQIPWLITQLSSDAQALSTTGSVGFSFAGRNLGRTDDAYRQTLPPTARPTRVHRKRVRSPSPATADGTDFSPSATNGAKRVKVRARTATNNDMRLMMQRIPAAAKGGNGTAPLGRASMPRKASGRARGGKSSGKRQKKTSSHSEDNTSLHSEATETVVEAHVAAQPTTDASHSKDVSSTHGKTQSSLIPASDPSSNFSKSARCTSPEAASPSYQETALEKLKRILELCDSFGMRYIEYDALQSLSWALVSSSGSCTDDHQDAAGYFTYVKCKSGIKLWCYLRPKAVCGDVSSAAQSMVDIIEDSADTDTFGNHSHPVSLLLTPGTILIQPAGWIHRVYTLANSIFTGGHFFMLDGMHLTEMTRACAAFTKQSATNASHPGCIRSLCRIALSIIFNHEETVLRKPFISLARMLIWSELYASGDVNPTDTAFERNGEAKLELEAARAAVEVILDHNHIKLLDIRPQALEKRDWLASVDRDLDWNDPGTSTLTVPDVRYLFRSYEGVDLGTQ